MSSHTCTLRYLAEVPDAHTEAFREALPFMLQLSEPAGVSSAAGGTGATGGADRACGIQFLMPGLLQVGVAERNA